MAIIDNAGVNDAGQAEISASSTTEADSLFQVRDDLETLAGNLSSMAMLAGFCGMRYSESDFHLSGAFFSLQNLADQFHADANGLVDRLMTLEDLAPGGAVAPTAAAIDNAWYRRTFEEWAAEVAADDGNGGEHSERAHRLYGAMLKNNATAPGDAAMKLRTICHSLFVSDAQSQFPDECAALSSVVADLEQMQAASNHLARKVRS